MARVRKVLENNNSFDLEVVTHHIEDSLQKLCDGENTQSYDEDFYFDGIVPVNVKSDDVDIRSIPLTCRLVNGGMEILGLPKPNPDLLDPRSRDTITSADEYKEFDEFVPFNGTTEDIIRRIDEVMESLSEHKEEVLELWEDMQESLNKSDFLKGQLWSLMMDFEKKVR